MPTEKNATSGAGLSGEDSAISSAESSRPPGLLVDVAPRPPQPGWVHLGDGAYVWHDGYQFWLRANSHTREQMTGEVALDPGAFRNFMAYAAQVLK